MFSIPPTSKRVTVNTSPEINRAISERTNSNIINYTNASEEKILQRISELDWEWDTERVLETNFAIISILCTILGYRVNKNFFLLGGIASGFLLQHALQGWCPPLTVLRNLGIRTANEIEYERQLLTDLCMMRN